VGLKGNLFDRRVSFASAAFLSKYKDQQVTTQVVVPSGIASSVDNAGASTLYGVEFEAKAKFSQHLSGTVAWATSTPSTTPSAASCRPARPTRSTPRRRSRPAAR
jgi:outer membrane receptor protein involved in Fe transport